jgi:hypothetical protein
MCEGGKRLLRDGVWDGIVRDYDVWGQVTMMVA